METKKEVSGRLPMLLGDNNENAVPKKVWLYPLHLIDNNVDINCDMPSRSTYSCTINRISPYDIVWNQ